VSAPDLPDAATQPGDLAEDVCGRAEIICGLVGAWHDCQPIPPLGERSTRAIRAGHDAVEEIDKLTRQLCQLREQLCSEMRQDEDIRNVRVDAMLAEARARRTAISERQSVRPAPAAGQPGGRAAASPGCLAAVQRPVPGVAAHGSALPGASCAQLSPGGQSVAGELPR
jgi:hypothetical protein